MVSGMLYNLATPAKRQHMHTAVPGFAHCQADSCYVLPRQVHASPLTATAPTTSSPSSSCCPRLCQLPVVVCLSGRLLQLTLGPPGCKRGQLRAHGCAFEMSIAFAARERFRRENMDNQYHIATRPNPQPSRVISSTSSKVTQTQSKCGAADTCLDVGGPQVLYGTGHMQHAALICRTAQLLI